MASKFFFAGRLNTTPLAVSAVDDTRMAPQNAAVGNNLALVGNSLAGAPNKALTFSSPREAARVLKGGELLVAVRKAFAPSAATAGPSKVTCVRVGKPTQATLTLKDSTGSDSIVLKSQDYGYLANQVRVQVEAGTLSGKRVTTRLDEVYYTADNLGKAAFSVRYAGAAASALLDVTPTTVVLKAGAVGTEATIATINLSDAPTVGQLADRINSFAGFTATVAGGGAQVRTLAGLDGVTAADVKTAAVAVRADLAAVIAWFNSNAEGFVTATRATGAKAAPVNVSYTYLSGAADPATVLQDWVDAIDVLTSQDVQHCVPLSADAAVHSAMDAHVIFMSAAGRKERRSYVGPEAGLTVDEVVLLPRALSSDRSALCWPGHYDTDLTTGERVLLPPYMTAVHVAGGFAGLNPGESMTNKSIRVAGIEFEPSFPADTDRLIDAGVLTLENTPRGIKVSRAISTWLNNDNFNRVEISTGIATDYVVRAVREGLEPLVGNKASPEILARAAQTVESILKSLARPAPAGPGVLVGDDNSPAYRNIVCEIQGDALYVNFECSPAVPLNFIGVGVAVVPYQGSVSL